MDYSQDRHDYFHEPVWRGSGFAVSGTVVGFFSGRLFDDLMAWRRTKVRPGFRISDLLFALTAAATGTLAATEKLHDLPGQPSLWHMIWNIVWILIGYSGVIMRVIQLAAKKKDTLVSGPISRLL